MIRITVLADNDIEDVYATEIQEALQRMGIRARRTRVRRQTERQYTKALMAGAAMLLIAGCGHHTPPPAPTVTNTPASTTLFPPPTDTPDTTATTTPSCTWNCTATPQTPPPFENPPNSSGIGKG